MVLSVHGKSDHSGATPMGHENRADGLVETARFLLGALEDEPTDSALEITAIDVADQAINKVPGVTTALLRISGGNVLAVAEQLASLEARRSQHNAALASPGFRFPEEPITLMEIERPDTAEFFAKAEVQARQKAALSLIVDVNEAATAHAGDKVVGTVGTYTMSPNGTISLGVDIRGIDKSLRNGVIEEIQAKAAEVEGKDGARFGERLAGSTDPVALDPGLVTRTKELIDSYAIGSSTVMYSAAGHDAQNAAMAGIPTVMIFCQSNAGGIAHHPDAYTNPHNLEQGVRALAALTMDLAA
jgi:acetylornithine deacetylase/succinyl-diaminopimelate desuccinylase-like protein